MSKKYAIIRSGVVENIIRATNWSEGVDVSSLDPCPDVGWLYNGTSFTPPAPDLVAEVPPLTTYDFDGLFSEVGTARGGAPTLGDRLSVISNFASPNAGPYISGRYYDNSFHATNATTIAGVANRVEMSPFFCSTPFELTEVGVSVSTAVSSAIGKCFIYNSGLDGLPGTLLWESSSDLAFNSTGYKFHSVTGSLANGRIYWVGVRHSSTATLRGVPLSSCVNLGLGSNNGTVYNTCIRSTLAYATPLPSTWTFAESQLTSSIITSIRLRSGGEL